MNINLKQTSKLKSIILEDVHKLINNCISATETYLEHSSKQEAQKQGKSQDIVNVTVSTPKVTEAGVEIFELEVNKPLKSNEFIIRDKHNGVEYVANRDFEVILYNRANDVITIKFRDSKMILNSGYSPNIDISFDLRVLIVNQREVYKSHSMDIARPDAQPLKEGVSGYQFVETLIHPALPEPNKDQKTSITTMLTTPLSFHEGPPGVGKTITLSIPALSYMADNKSIAIITPTKVSLERSLSAVIDLCRKVGLDSSKILKQGDSSSEYIQKYPETLESAGVNKFIQEEKLELFCLEVALEYQKMKEQIEQKDEILTLQMLLNDLLINLTSLKKAKPNSLEVKNLLKMVNIKISNIQMNTTASILKSIFQNLNYQNYNDIFVRFNEYAQKFKDSANKKPLTKKDRDLLRVNNIDNSSFGNRVELYEELIGAKYDNYSEDELKSLINESRIKIAKFKKQYIQERRKSALIIGMTADSYNSRYKDETLNVEHIFVDEGGYLPLIKIFGMCRQNIPISILGDTKQLPPVFEMSYQIKENSPFESTLLYELNAFHLDTLFNEGYDGLKKAYFNKEEPKILSAKVSISQTYRFGSKLADILNFYVYRNGFNSAIDNCNFKLEYIDAVNMVALPGNRVNPAETDAIKYYLSDNISENTAILTPYKGQVSNLKKELKGLIDTNQIMSIHKSQGQEWDTVILSVVDHQSVGGYGMWFTSSQNKISEGLRVINTAVSRCKIRLVLVGHYRFWVTQKDELLGELFRNADELKINQYERVA